MRILAIFLFSALAFGQLRINVQSKATATLAAGINATATSLELSSSAEFLTDPLKTTQTRPFPFILTVDAEQISVCAVNGNGNVFTVGPVSDEYMSYPPPYPASGRTSGKTLPVSAGGVTSQLAGSSPCAFSPSSDP